MLSTNNSELVRRCFTAWETGDRATLETLLADNFTFSSPNDDHLSLSQYWEICWANHDAIRAINVMSLVEGEQEAFALYESELKDGKRFMNTEHFQFEGDKIREVNVFFGRTLSSKT